MVAVEVKTVTYKKPIIRRTQVGSKPRHHFDQNPNPSQDYVQCSGGACQSKAHKVWRDQPDKMADGSPVLVEVTETIDLTPRSPWKYGGIAGGIGALVGAGAGLFASSAMKMHPAAGAAVGALAIGGVAGAIGALAVYGEKTKLVWDSHQIIDHQMLGYQELVGPGQSGDQKGYFHRYVPDVQESVIGTYDTPRVVRFKKEAEAHENS